MNEVEISNIARVLFACAKRASNSEQKRAHLIALPNMVLALANDIATGNYKPQPFTVFAVTAPKLREIFAPAFADRIVHHWLVSQIEPWWNKRFIDDSYANRQGKGTQAAIERLQALMRREHHRWYCKLDVQAFFPSIDRTILLALWQRALPRLPYPVATRKRLEQVATAILTQDPIQPQPLRSGDQALLNRIPPHKSLFHAQPGKGLPIGSLTSQFFANVYMNELDQYAKHQLRIGGYIRYVDDIILLGPDVATLMAWKAQIECFLRERLALTLHPRKTVIQRCKQGADFLGAIVHPGHRLSRQRTVRALRRRISWFNQLLGSPSHLPPPLSGHWHRWLANHPPLLPDGSPSLALLQRILATLNSYYGFFSHANTWQLRQHLYHHELGELRRYFLPDGPGYHHLRIRKAWLPLAHQQAAQQSVPRPGWVV